MYFAAEDSVRSHAVPENITRVPSPSEQLAEIVKDVRAMREAARESVEHAEEMVRAPKILSPTSD